MSWNTGNGILSYFNSKSEKNHHQKHTCLKSRPRSAGSVCAECRLGGLASRPLFSLCYSCTQGPREGGGLTRHSPLTRRAGSEGTGQPTSAAPERSTEFQKGQGHDGGLETLEKQQILVCTICDKARTHAIHFPASCGEQETSGYTELPNDRNSHTGTEVQSVNPAICQLYFNKPGVEGHKPS